MTVDERLVSQARLAAGQINARQQDLDAARDGFTRSVRALYLGGASMREIAEVLGLSHQRVHQLLDLPREPGRRRTPVRAPRCSFCGRDQKKVGKLIAGPNSAGICNDCVVLATTVVAHGAPATDPRTTLHPAAAGRCSFCGKQAGDGVEPVTLVTVDQPGAVVCSECLNLCHEIIADESPS